MQFLFELWLPIVLSAVFVFIVSSIIHMATPMHKGDCRKLKNEDAVLEALRSHGVEPGAYVFPCAGSMKGMCSPEMLEKMKRGPCGWLTVAPPGGFNIGKSLVCWFIYCLIIGFFVAYLTWHTVQPGANYRAVFRIVGAAAVLAYAAGHFHDAIWKGASWGTSAKFALDGVVYGLVTAGAFGWLWPRPA